MDFLNTKEAWAGIAAVIASLISFFAVTRRVRVEAEDVFTSRYNSLALELDKTKARELLLIERLNEMQEKINLQAEELARLRVAMIAIGGKI